MNSFLAVFKRELKSYFTTPLAYVFLVIFLFVAGFGTFKQGFFQARQADMSRFFMNMPLFFVFISSATAMRLWAEERKIGSVELLFTLPITIGQAVIGKFLAAWIFLTIALVLTFPMVLTVNYLGDPDLGAIMTGYLGCWLLAGAFLAVGCFFSALSKNQVISFVLATVACSVLYILGLPTTMKYLGGWLPTGLVNAIEAMSLQIRFESMQRGLLKLGDIAYFIILIIGWTTACTVILDERKAS